jgi:hypothetical protein
MGLEDREAIVATVEERCALMRRALSTDVPGDAAELGCRRRPYVTDDEMLELLRTAYLDLVAAGASCS